MIEMVAADAVDVILRDGTTLRLRPPRSSDLGAATALFAGLSSESSRMRFHGGVAITTRVPCVAVDARVRVARPQPVVRAKSW